MLQNFLKLFAKEIQTLQKKGTETERRARKRPEPMYKLKAKEHFSGRHRKPDVLVGVVCVCVCLPLFTWGQGLLRVHHSSAGTVPRDGAVGHLILISQPERETVLLGTKACP